MLNAIIRISVIVVNLFLLFVSLLISPYRDELPDLNEKYVNDDGVLVLRLIYILVIIFSVLYLIRFPKLNGLANIIVGLSAAFCSFKFLATFFL